MSESIRLVDLKRDFTRGDSDVHALRGIDLTITPGEFVALVGPSGSGKSSLLNLLGGLDRASAGEIWVGDTALHDAGERIRNSHRRHRVGFIFQSFNLLPRLTALENVALPLMLAGVSREQRNQRATAMLERVGLGHRLDHYPAELSGGEQQRTAIARALIHEPTLVLADEPTGNLDTATGEAIMDLLRELNVESGVTLVLVTHNPEVAAYAEREVRLRDGDIEQIVESMSRGAAATPSTNGHGPRTAKANVRSSGGLGLGDIVRSAFRNLGRRPVRNILTAGGVLIGIITLVAMVSFGVGVQREVQRNFATIGLENIIVVPEFAQQDGFDPFADPIPASPMTPGVIAQLRQIPGVDTVTPEVSLPRGIDLTLQRGEVSTGFRVSDGGEQRFTFANADENLAGENFPEGDTSGMVLSSSVADQLLGEGESYDDLIGESLTIVAQLPRGETENFPTPVIGVRRGFGDRSIDLGVVQSAAIKGWWFGEEAWLESNGYDAAVVRADSLGDVAEVSTAIEDLGLQAQSLEAILDVANQVLGLLQALLGSVGGLALLVAALGVANTMMMAIYERTREIGVLKALGASAREIRSLFTVEAALIGFIGGVFGLILGILLGRLVDWIGHRYLISEGITGVGPLSVVPWWLALGAIAFATAIGLLAGLYPAARAARLDPVTALRHE